MVFEGVLVDLLNRFLGSYVKNLDASQLKVGIFGGDVLLERLDLKENALDELNLPVRIFGGHLDKLRLKIPWSNLYSAPVVAEVDGLFVVAGPASAAKYDAERDAWEKKDNKDRQLKKIEDVRKKTLETKDKKDQAPGLVEKLVTQIIRNVQVTVRNIHVTFEDGVTDPSHPFSVGVTLDSLVVQSTDSNYVIGGQDVDPVSQLIYKLVHMSCLSLYWNTDTRLLLDGKLPSNWAETLKNRIARSHDTSSDMQFLLRPISAKAKLQLTMKPGVDEAIPQALVNVVLEHIAISLGKQQYCNIMSLVESFDRMSINQKYLKYKPLKGVSKDLRAWWRYAITAVLEEDVKRRTRMWSWKHIKKYRARCKRYRERYVEKLLAKKVSDKLQGELDELEANLDVLNIILCRQLAESKAERQLAAREKLKAKSGGGGLWGWTTSWVAGSPDQEPIITQPPTDVELAKEKEKLYEALGYSESGGKPSYSKEYVAHKVVVDLKKVSLQLYNPHGAVSELLADRVGVAFMQRPASGNISVTASLGSLTMNGRGQGGGEPPTIIQTNQRTAGSLLDVRFELKPLGKRADYSIMAKLKPVQIIYDADTIDDIIGMFLLPKDVQLQKLSAAASSRLEEVKTQGRAGLEHSIGQKKVMEMDISLHSPYLIIPENGALTKSSTVLLVDLGSLQVTSAPQQLDSVRHATREQLEAAFYDDFDIELRNVQVIVAGVSDDWKGARRDVSSPLHILTPTMLDLRVKNSLMDDAKLPKIKVSGTLPKLKLSLSDKKIKQVLKIFQSLPLPPPSLASKSETSKYSYDPSAHFSVNTEGLLSTMPTPLLPATTEGDGSDDEVWYTAEEGSFNESTGSYVCLAKKEDTSKKTVSANKLDLSFSIPEIKINFSEHDEQSQKDTSRLDLIVTSVSTSVQHRTWDTGVTASIGSLIVDDHYTRGVVRVEPHRLLSTVASEETEKNTFLSVKYKKADSTGPHFQSLFASTQQSIDVNLSLLRLQLHRESLTNLLAITWDITDQIKNKAKAKDKLSSPTGTEITKSRTKIDETTAAVSKSVARVPGEKDLDLAAKLTGIELMLSDDNGNLLTSNIKGVETSVVVEEKAINISASLSDVSLMDMDPGSRHPNVIVKMDKLEKIISTNVVVYKNAPKTDLNTADLSVKAKVQRLKVTILFKFLNKIKGFVSEFLTQLKLDPKTIDLAKKAAAKTATRTAEALREQSSSRVRLDITVLAPILVLPLSALSQAAFIADLGHLKVKNNFFHADSIYEGSDKSSFVSASGEKALLDKMEVSLSSIQLGRIERLKKVTKPSPDHMIVEPLEFKGLVTRCLSSWCAAVPALDVQANLQTLKLRFSPEDYHVTMSLLSSLNEGASARPPPISPKEKDTQPEESEESVDPQTTKKVGVTEGGVNIRVAAIVGAVELALHTKGETVATVRMEDLVTDVELLSNIIQIKVGISDVKISDLPSLNPDHLHPKIVSVTGATKALEAKIGVYPQATKSLEGYLDTNQCDVSVEASVGQLRLVLLFLFVSKMTNFFKELQLSQEAIDKAKRSAQESATAAINAVQEQHTGSQRLTLSITLKAPEIVVPLHSNSGEVIVADLGVLRLSNSFHLVEGWSGGERPPLYEEYDIQLKDLQVYRTLVNVDNNPPRSSILEPFNLSLAMKRNLSTSWYTDMPTIELDASLGNLKMSASDTDIEALCQVLIGNLKESSDYTPTTPTKNEAPADAVKGSLQPVPDDGVTSDLSVKTDTKTSSTVFKMLVLKATLKSIEIELFKSQRVSDKWAKGSHNSFVSLALDRFSSTVCIESNGAMAATVEMLNACLDDSRSMPNKKVARLIEKVMENKGSTAPLVSVSLNKSPDGDSSVDCTVESAKVLIDVVFIFLLLDYLKKSVSSLSKPAEPSTVREPLLPSIGFAHSLEDSIKSPTSEPIVEATKRNNDKPIGTLSVKVKITRPLIALLKDAEDKDSPALVLRSTVDFFMEQVPNGLGLKTEMSELAIFATRISNLRNRATKVLEVKNLQPIKFAMQQSTSEGIAMDVEIPDVVLSFSPTTIRLILHVVKALPITARNPEKIGDTVPLEAKPVDSSDLYPSHKVEAIEGKVTPVDQAMPPKRNVMVTKEKLSLVINSLLVLVEDTMVGGCPSPMVSIKMGNYTQCDTKAMQLTVVNWSTQLYAVSTVSMEVSYFNLGHNVWEPLLEPSVDPNYENQEVSLPWTIKATCSVSRNFSASLDRRYSHSSSVSSPTGSHGYLTSANIVTAQPSKQDKLPPEISIEIVSEMPLVVTLTKSCLILLNDLWTLYGVEEPEVTGSETMEAAFVIENKSSLHESTGCIDKDSEGSEKKTISATKLDLTFSIPEMRMNLCEHNDQSHTIIPRIGLIVTSVFTSVQQRTWDMGVAASIGSLTINDHYKRKGTSVKSQHLLTCRSAPGKETEKQTFLSVKYTQADSTGPQFQSLFASTQQSIDVNLSLLRLQLHRESLTNLLAITRDITDQIKSKAKAKDDLPSPSRGAISKPVARIPEEKNLDFTAKLTGIEMIVSDDNGNLFTSTIKGVETSVVVEKKAINISASVSDVSLVDMDPGSCHPNVIVKMDNSEKVFFTNVVVYKDAPKTDINTADLSIKAKVQKLKVTVLFRFLNSIKMFAGDFLTQLKLNQKAIDSAKEASAEISNETAEALREQSSSRIRLDITVLAPVLVLPLSAFSQAAFIADLGRLEVRNNFLHADPIYEWIEDVDSSPFVSSSGEKALLDKMEVSLSSIQLGRVENLKEEVKLSPDHMIIEPLEFRGVVTRSLSSWCVAVPAVDVEANVQTLKLRFSPEDYHVTMSLLSSLNEGASTGPPSISLKEKDTQHKPEKSLDIQPTKEVSRVNIRVAAVVGAVELALHTKGETVATVRMEDLMTEVVLLSNTVQVKVGISDVNVFDHSLNPNHFYPKIVSITGVTKALEAKIGIYPQATKSLEGYLDTNQCDVSVEASVGQLRLVLLFLFVSKMTYFLKELQRSQEVIDKAKRSAQESATAAVNAVQEKQTSGQRIKLSITLQAPEIVVPLHSNSGEVIVADLGVLRLSNSFHLVGGWSGGERPPLYEEYDIQLKDLQVYRTLVGVANNPPRSPVLEPFNLSLVMKRNLSISWYTDMPTIDLDASLGNLKMSASDADIEALCQVLTGNLRESLDHTPTTPTKNETPADAVEGSSLPKPAEGVKGHASVETEDTKTSFQVFKMLVLKATLKSIEIELFKSQKDSDKWVKGNHNSFASLDLHQFSSTVCIESNGAVGVAVEMLDACLEDSRSMPNKKLIRLIDKVMEDEGSTVPLVSVSFNITSNGDSSVDCTVESAKVLVDVVFIFLLLDYLKTSVSSLSKPTELSTTQKLPSPLISDAVFSETIDSVCQESIKSPSLKSPSLKTPSPTPEPIEEATKISNDDKPLRTLSVKVKVLRPLIALLKNSEQKNTRALVLGSTVDFSMEQGPTGMALKTEISELAIFATRVSNLRNTATKVLEVKNSKPIKFGMQQSTSEGTAIDIEVPDVVLSFSPTTVRLILHVVKALPVTAKDSDVEIGETSPLDLWETRPVDSSSWYLNPPVPSRNVEGTSVDQAMPLEEVFDVDEKLSLVIDSLLVLVEEETVVGGNPFPVISMKMGNYTQSNAKAMELTATNWSTELNVLSTVSMEVSYFNLGHNVWEPLLEPSVDPSYENQEVYIPWTLKASIWKDLSVTSVDKGNSRSSSVSSRIGSRRSMSSTSSVTTQPGKQDELPPEISVEIMSETPLLLTLTKSCLMLFKDLWIAYGEVEQEVTEDVDSMAHEAMEAVFVIKNELGLNYPFTVYTKDTLKVHGAYSSTVRHGRSVPLHPMTEALQLKPGEYLPREVYKKRRVHIVTIAIPSFKPIDVALGTSECVYYPLILADKSSSKKAKDSPQFGVVIDIKMSQRVPEVRIRSPLQVVNNLSEEVQVFWRKDSSEPLPPTPLTTLPGGSTHSLPLETTGSPDGGFHLNPVSSGTVPSKHSISWVNKEKSFDLGCYSSSRGYPFFMHVVIDEERYSRQPSINIASRAHHAFVLNYPLVLQNLLPLSVTVTEKTDSTVSKELPPGSKTNYSHVALSEEPRFHTKIDYNGRIWSGEVCLDEESDEYTQLTLKPEYSVDKGGEKDKNEEETSCLKLMIHVQEMGSWQLTLYCPYWIVNKTGLMLEYAGKSTDVVTVHHPQLPMALFPYKEVKVRVRGSSLQNSDWSKAFSLDAAGSEGVFRCLDKKSKQEYQMGTTVTTSSVGLSKVITISPLFMTFNQTRDEISFKVGEDLQIYTVKSKQLLVFWPKSNSEQMSLSVNDQKMSNPSKAFKFTENSSRLIQTNDLIPAVVTEIQVTGSANVVTFSPYYEGVVPVKIVNSMAYDMEFKQTAEHIKGTQTIPAGQSVFYSWRAPLVQKKAISWRIVYPAQRLKMKSILTKDDGGKFKIPSKLLPHSESTTSLHSLSGDTQGSVSDWEDSVDFPEWEELSADDEDGNLSGIEEDDEGEDEEGKDLTDFSVKHGLGVIGRGFTSTKKKLFQRRSKSRGKTVGYWVSFLDGLQRVILFTTSHEVWSHVMGGQKTERASTELFSLSLREVGLSLVNDERGLEVAYIGIRPSKPIWEILKRWNRWKPVSNHLRKHLEKIIEKPKEEIEGKVIPVPESNYKIDFSAESSWMLVEKNGTRIHVRRSHFEGVFVQVTLSEHLTSIETKINEIQIDNHLLFTSNPIILFAYPTPPTIASKYEPKPFIESSMILRNSAQSNVKQVQLFQVLIQEIGLNVDMNFILAIADLLANLPSGVTEIEGIERDLSISKFPLEKSKVEQVSAAATRNYFKFLHLSPLAIHLSFYLDRDASYKPDEHKDSSSNSVFGAVLNAFTQFAFLVGRTKDAELRLGYFELDEVALTQTGLLSRIQKHYTQQAVLQLYSVVLGLEVLGNPVGFVKGLKDGTINLFYHPIQGAVLGPGEFFEGLALGGREFFSSTIGGLSGALGKVSGAIGDIAAKMTGDDEFQEDRRRSDTWGQSLEGAAKGFVSGLTGVITQPYKGAKKEGAWGAIKGFSKGIVGVVLRPTAGILDLTSATFNAVQKKSKAGDSTVAEIRAARYIGPERIVFPYSPRRSTGYALFVDIDNGRLLETDTYFDHVELIDNPLKVLLITSRQLAVVKMSSIRGRFDDDYTVDFTEFTGPARIDEKHNSVVVMPVREETFAGLRFISGKKNYKEFNKTLAVLNEGIAKKSVELINQAYEEFRATAAIDY